MASWLNEPRSTPLCECAHDECPCGGAHNRPGQVYVKAADNQQPDPPSFFCVDCADRAVLLGAAVFTDIDGKPLEGAELRAQLDRNYYAHIVTGQGKGVCLFPPSVDAIALEARLVLVCSSAHIRKEDTAVLEMDGLTEREGISTLRWDYGWQVVFDAESLDMSALEEPTRFSDEFWELLRFARARGFDRVDIDADGPKILGLPTFDW